MVVVFGVFGQMPLVSDGNEYARQAAVFVRDHAGAHAYYWPPGTSYYIAAGYVVFGVHIWVARATTIVVSVLAVAMVIVLAAQVLRDRRSVTVAGWVIALYPPVVMGASQTFGLDLPLLCVVIVAWSALAGWETRRLRYFVLGGFALGAAAVARPASASVAIGLAAMGLVAAHRAARARDGVTLRLLGEGVVVVAILAAATVYPALRHNHALGQGRTISVNNEQNLWLGNNPYTPDYMTAELGQHPINHFQPAVRSYLARYDFVGLPSRPLRRRMQHEALRYMARHPGVTALRSLNRARAFWGFDYTLSRDVQVLWHQGVRGLALSLPFEAGGYLVFGLLAILGLTSGRGLLLPGRAVFLLVLVAASELPYVFSFSGAKWHYPVVGLLVPFAAAGFVWLTSAADGWSRLRRARGFWIAAALFTVIQLEWAYQTLTVSA